MNTQILPIPLDAGTVDGWKVLPIRESGDPLIAVGLGTRYLFYTSAIYAGERTESPYYTQPLEASLLTMFLRKAVVRRLEHAEKLLPPRHHLVLFDAYRRLDVQHVLFDHYFQALSRVQPTWDEAALSTETQKFVSLPSPTNAYPAPHNTGVAVDLAIYTLSPEDEASITEVHKRLTHMSPNDDAYVAVQSEALRRIAQKGTLLDFGTAYDYGGREASLVYYEELASMRKLSTEEKDAQTNRRLLYHTMQQVGMVSFRSEWWHYNALETQMGAQAIKNEFATYGAISLTPTQEQHEQQRRVYLSANNDRFTTMRSAAELVPPAEQAQLTH